MKDEKHQKIIYKEVQKFTSPLIWILLSALLLIFLFLFAFTIYSDLSFDKFLGDDYSTADYVWIIICLLIVMGLFILFSIMKLTTIITSDHLLINYKPFFSKKIILNDIIGFAQRKFRPLVEYRGWGIRYSIFGHGWGYTVKGNIGIQFLTRSGKKFLLGTQKPEELIYYLNEYINSDKSESLS